jgi:hypothetical protein
VDVAAVITSLPEGVGTVALKAPLPSAVVVTTVVVLAGEPGWPEVTTTVAPGVVVPVTVVVAPVVIAPADGPVSVTATSDGGLDLR